MALWNRETTTRSPMPVSRARYRAASTPEARYIPTVVAEAGDGQHGQGVLIEQGAQDTAAGKESGEVEAGQVLVGALPRRSRTRSHTPVWGSGRWSVS